MDNPTLAGIVGAVSLAIIGWIGRYLAVAAQSQATRREQRIAGDIDLAKAREARPWALMESRIEDLEGERDRLALLAREQSALIDRIRHERDEARRSAVEWELAAKRAATLRESMVVEVREDHARILALLRAIRDALRHGK